MNTTKQYNVEARILIAIVATVWLLFTFFLIDLLEVAKSVFLILWIVTSILVTLACIPWEFSSSSEDKSPYS